MLYVFYVMILSLAACGITQPRYIKYGAPANTSQAKRSCASALEAFKDSIQTASDGTCQACHGPGRSAAGTLTFVKGDTEISASAFKSTRFGLDGGRIWAYISSEQHPGFINARETLSEDTIITWLKAENECL